MLCEEITSQSGVTEAARFSVTRFALPHRPLHAQL